MGKGDKKTKRGKIWKGTYGNTRKQKVKRNASHIDKIKHQGEGEPVVETKSKSKAPTASKKILKAKTKAASTTSSKTSSSPKSTKKTTAKTSKSIEKPKVKKSAQSKTKTPPKKSKSAPAKKEKTTKPKAEK